MAGQDHRAVFTGQKAAAEANIFRVKRAAAGCDGVVKKVYAAAERIGYRVVCFYGGHHHQRELAPSTSNPTHYFQISYIHLKTACSSRHVISVCGSSSSHKSNGSAL